MFKFAKPLIFIVLLALVLGCSKPGTETWPDDSEMAYRSLMRGVDLAGKGQLEQALVAMDKAIELDPDWIVLLYNRAIVYAGLGQKDKEVAAYQQVIALAPQAGKHERERILSASYYNLVFIALSRGDVDQAFAWLDKALATTTHVDAFYQELVGSPELAILRQDQRFKPLMQRYWPNYGVVVGRLPAASASR